MTKIFISYRRKDSSTFVGRMADRLASHFGADQVFMDIETIQPGENFVEVVENAVSNCDIALVVIGDEWLTITDGTGRRRLDDPGDFVRIEIAAALSRGIHVIPVLINGASMPRADELPDNLKLLARHIAQVIGDGESHGHIDQLIVVMDQVLAADSMRQPAPARAQFELPQPFAWIYIPAGQVTLEDRHGTFDITAFRIAKYPTTVAQYTLFVEAGGYDTEVYWTTAGWSWRQQDNTSLPRYWDDERFHKSNYPIVGVSWYECYAFTRWLSEMTDENIALPTEQQWQRAAQGDDGRKYPWGVRWNKSNANADGDYGSTTPVTQFEGKGDSPFGVVDMSGNVSEWTRSVYKSAKPDMDSTNARVLRGGWWGLNRNRVCVTSRSCSDRAGRGGGGFRIVCVSPIT